MKDLLENVKFSFPKAIKKSLSKTACDQTVSALLANCKLLDLEQESRYWPNPNSSAKPPFHILENVPVKGGAVIYVPLNVVFKTFTELKKPHYNTSSSRQNPSKSTETENTSCA